MKKIELFLVVILLLFSVNSFSQGISDEKLSKREINSIKNLMAKELCADLENRLYVIDGRYAFWVRKGNCSDNSYSYTLYGRGVKTLCYMRETIAGPDKKCNDKDEAIFITMIENLDEQNLGLADTIKVLMVHSFKKKNTP